MSMDHSPYAVRKQNIHFLRFYNLSYLSLAERGMNKYLTFTIRSPAIVWGAGFNRGT